MKEERTRSRRWRSKGVNNRKEEGKERMFTRGHEERKKEHDGWKRKREHEGNKEGRDEAAGREREGKA